MNGFAFVPKTRGKTLLPLFAWCGHFPAETSRARKGSPSEIGFLTQWCPHNRSRSGFFAVFSGIKEAALRLVPQGQFFNPTGIESFSPGLPDS
jgi:hypothetical protein